MNKSAQSEESGAVRWGLSFARGYLELGMIDRAERELTLLGPSHDQNPEILRVRCEAVLARSRWKRLIALSGAASRRYPERPEFYVFSALAYEQLGRPAESKGVWLAAPRQVRGSGYFHYSVARCEVKLGNFKSAREHLVRALKLDPELRAAVREDPSLQLLFAAPPLS